MGLDQRYQELVASLGLEQPRIVAVTKYASDEQLLAAYELGIRDFAENYVLTAMQRIDRLASLLPEARWHFCGHLQKNKVNKAVGRFSLIQSIDSLSLAALVSARAEVLKLKQAVLIQVKLSQEQSKTGYQVQDLRQDFPSLLKFPGLKIEGLMVMAPELGQDDSCIREIFGHLATLKTNLEREHNCQLSELSMGMSDDYALAIQQGSTMIRIGRALFEEGAGQNLKPVVK